MMAMVTFANAAYHMYTKNRIITTNISQLKGKIFYLNAYKSKRFLCQATLLKFRRPLWFGGQQP